MKPFNLEKALAGAKVVTGDGREVSQITKFECSNKCNIVAVVDYQLETFTRMGKYNTLRTDKSMDLFMAPDKRKFYIGINIDCIYPSFLTTPEAYTSYESALNACKRMFDKSQIVEIEIEE